MGVKMRVAPQPPHLSRALHKTVLLTLQLLQNVSLIHIARYNATTEKKTHQLLVETDIICFAVNVKNCYSNCN